VFAVYLDLHCLHMRRPSKQRDRSAWLRHEIIGPVCSTLHAERAELAQSAHGISLSCSYRLLFKHSFWDEKLLPCRKRSLRACST